MSARTSLFPIQNLLSEELASQAGIVGLQAGFESTGKPQHFESVKNDSPREEDGLLSGCSGTACRSTRVRSEHGAALFSEP